jgi:hypothetical protein
MTIEQFNPSYTRRSFMQQVQDSLEAHRSAAVEHPWVPMLRRLKGRTGADGVQRIGTGDVFDALEIPMKRRPSQTVGLSRLMRELGWRNIRARGLNRGSYRDRVRGFAREVPDHPVTVRLPNEF